MSLVHYFNVQRNSPTVRTLAWIGAIFAILFFVFSITRGVTPHAAELVFREHSSNAIGSVVPASCESDPYISNTDGNYDGCAVLWCWQGYSYTPAQQGWICPPEPPPVPLTCWDGSVVFPSLGQICPYLPAPTNLVASCPLPGNVATLTWTLPPGFNEAYLRIDDQSLVGSCGGGPAEICVPENSQSVSTSYTFSSIPGHSYNWWIYTKNANPWWSYPATNGPQFTCSANQPPTVNAGPDVYFYKNNATASPIGATVSDPEGTLLYHYWRLKTDVGLAAAPLNLRPTISNGGPGNVPSGSILTPVMSNLIHDNSVSEKYYEFELVAIDTGGVTSTDTMRMIWPGDKVPRLRAGEDMSIQLPIDAVSPRIDAFGGLTDTRNATLYAPNVGASTVTAWWELVSKPQSIAAPIFVLGTGSPATSHNLDDTPRTIPQGSTRFVRTQFTNLTIPGEYVFRLKALRTVLGVPYEVSDDMTVTVLGAGMPTCPPATISSCSLPTGLPNPTSPIPGTCMAPNSSGICRYICKADGTWSHDAPSMNICNSPTFPVKGGIEQTIRLPISATTTVGASVHNPVSYPSYCTSSVLDSLGNYIFGAPLFATWPATFYGPCEPAHRLLKQWSYQWQTVSKPTGAPDPSFSIGETIVNVTDTGSTTPTNTTISNLTVPGTYRFALHAANGHDLIGSSSDSVFTRINVLPPLCLGTTIQNCQLFETLPDTTVNGVCTIPGNTCSYSCGTSADWNMVSNSCVSPASPCSATIIDNCELTSKSVGSSDGKCATGYAGTCTYNCVAGSNWDTTGGSFTNTCVAVFGSISVDDPTPDYGDPVTLNWTTTGVTSCTVTGNGQSFSGTQGTNVVTDQVFNDTTFVLACNSDPAILDQASVDVNNGISLEASHRVVKKGTQVTLTWNTTSTDESLCALSGHGMYPNPMYPAQAPNNKGSVTVVVNGNSEYTLTCPDLAIPGNTLIKKRKIEVVASSSET